MAEIPESISNLDNDGLRKKLIDAGITVGPLTPITKKLYQKKLAQKLGSLIVVKNFSDKLKCAANVSQNNRDQNASPVKFKEEENSNSNKDEGFYAVLLPSNDPSNSSEKNIFTKRPEAFKFLTKNKGARLKHFATESEAEQFCLHKTQEACTSSQSSPTEFVNIEKVNEFKTPKQEELNRLMWAIEQNNIDTFRKLVWSNPRYLINSGDGPVQLKQSARYNSLHIAARTNQPEMIREILSTLENPEFLNLMYPNSTRENNELVSHILDLYFNTPEKGIYETPLHFASKLGFLDCVLELVSNKHCSVSMKNKFNQTPFDVCCSRAKNASTETKNEILALLHDQFYLPLFRCHDNSRQPVIGKPETAKNTLNQQTMQPHNPTDPVVVVSALVGPMTSGEANEMRKLWMTPDKKEMKGKIMLHIRRSDIDKGDERIGRELAKKADVPWMEYWDFLKKYADFSTNDGLELLNDYLKSRHYQDSESLIPTPSESESIIDICAQLTDLKVDDSAFATSPHPNKTSSKILEVSTPVHTSTVKHNFGSPTNTFDTRLLEIPKTPKERRLDSIRDSLLQTRERQLSRVSDSIDPESSRISTCSSPVFCSSTFFDVHNPKKEKSVEEMSKTFNGINLEKSDSEVSAMEVDSLTSCKMQSFLTSFQPTKLDSDVILAIGNTAINPSTFPYIWKWMNAVLSYSEDDRSRWRTPKKSISTFTKIKKQPLPFVWPASPMAKNKKLSINEDNISPDK